MKDSVEYGRARAKIRSAFKFKADGEFVIFENFLNRIISDGIAEVCEAYASPEEQHKRDGAIEGFEGCRGKAPADLVALWVEAEKL